MKEVKGFIIVDIIILLIKVLGVFLTKSLTIGACALYDLLLIVTMLCVLKSKENKRYKGVLSALLAFLFIIGNVGYIFLTFMLPLTKTSLFLILFVLISIFARYIVGCFCTNINFQKKVGLLGFSNLSSNSDFILLGFAIIAMIATKFSGMLDILKYADRVGVILVSLFSFIKCFKIIWNSFNYIEDRELNMIDKEEISNREEVKKIDGIKVNSFGGISHVNIDLVLNDSVSMIDANTFIISLEDYILKFSSLVSVHMTNGMQKKKVKTHVRSLKQDARNSGSRNSKTNTKKKNTKKKNKKR